MFTHLKPHSQKCFCFYSNYEYLSPYQQRKIYSEQGKNSDLCLSGDDISVSCNHAVIYRLSSGMRVEDAGSRNDVYVNNGIEKNQPIKQNVHVQLIAGDIVRFGKIDKIFRLENVEVKVSVHIGNGTI